jgi:LEA14-like dessication related protein
MVPAMRQTFASPVIVLASSKVEEVSAIKLAVRFKLEAANPNDYDLRVRHVRYRVVVAGTRVAEGTQASTVVLPADGSGTLEVEALINRRMLYTLAPDLEALGEVAYELELWVALGPSIGGHEVHVGESGAMRIDIPLELAGIAFGHSDWQRGSSSTHVRRAT